MNRAYRILPVYAGDVSGVCSALYELGGMTVMHDPSGCNSTYNTHDETRWYEQDSLIFISGLRHRDAVLGNDNRLLDAVTDAAASLKPRFITLCGSPIPFLNGTDFPALARLLESRTGIPTITVPTNGMHDYVCGAGAALRAVADRFVIDEDPVIPHSVNILGVTPLDFAAKGSVSSLKALLLAHGWQTVSCWSMGDSFDSLLNAGRAEVNLVISSAGLACAKLLEQRFGTPYIVGAPIGQFSDMVFRAMEQKRTAVLSTEPQLQKKPVLTVIGEPVQAGSLARAIELQFGISVRLLCPLEQHNGLLAPNDRPVCGEEEAEAVLRDSEYIIADPLYRPICPPTAAFYSLPHQAFSGRCFRKEMKDPFSLF